MNLPASRRVPALPAFLAVLPLSLVLVSCVAVPPGGDWYGTAPIYGTPGSDWKSPRWEDAEAHRREMVRRQKEYRRRAAERERNARWRSEERRRDAYEPPRRSDAAPAPRDAGPPDLRPERRLEPSDPPRPEASARDDYPTGIPVIGKEGMAYNPAGIPDQMIDVRGIPSGTLVKDPYTDTIFRVP